VPLKHFDTVVHPLPQRVNVSLIVEQLRYCTGVQQALQGSRLHLLALLKPVSSHQLSKFAVHAGRLIVITKSQPLVWQLHT
jgi:hypothetical protein